MLAEIKSHIESNKRNWIVKVSFDQVDMRAGFNRLPFVPRSQVTRYFSFLPVGQSTLVKAASTWQQSLVWHRGKLRPLYTYVDNATRQHQRADDMSCTGNANLDVGWKVNVFIKRPPFLWRFETLSTGISISGLHFRVKEHITMTTQ